MLHSYLAVVPRQDWVEILGVAAPRVWRRMEVKRGTETRTERAYRRNESDVWAEVVEAIGWAPAPETQVLWVSVGDRGSDIFSYLRRARVKNWHCLFRVCQDRVIWNAKAEQGRRGAGGEGNASNGGKNNGEARSRGGTEAKCGVTGSLVKGADSSPCTRQ